MHKIITMEAGLQFKTKEMIMMNGFKFKEITINNNDFL